MHTIEPQSASSQSRDFESDTVDAVDGEACLLYSTHPTVLTAEVDLTFSLIFLDLSFVSFLFQSLRVLAYSPYNLSVAVISNHRACLCLILLSLRCMYVDWHVMFCTYSHSEKERGQENVYIYGKIQKAKDTYAYAERERE